MAPAFMSVPGVEDRESMCRSAPMSDRVYWADEFGDRPWSYCRYYLRGGDGQRLGPYDGVARRVHRWPERRHELGLLARWRHASVVVDEVIARTGAVLAGRRVYEVGRRVQRPEAEGCSTDAGAVHISS